MRSSKNIGRPRIGNVKDNVSPRSLQPSTVPRSLKYLVFVSEIFSLLGWYALISCLTWLWLLQISRKEQISELWIASARNHRIHWTKTDTRNPNIQVGIYTSKIILPLQEKLGRNMYQACSIRSVVKNRVRHVCRMLENDVREVVRFRELWPSSWK